MKKILGFFQFILSSILRLLPFLIFSIIHIFWSVYIYVVNPLDLLDLRSLPEALGDFKYLYLSLGIVIFVFLTLRLKFLAYSTFFGALIGQTMYFLTIWNNKIYGMGKPGFLYKWYLLIFLGLIIGFVLQLLKTGGSKLLKQKKYERIRNSK